MPSRFRITLIVALSLMIGFSFGFLNTHLTNHRPAKLAYERLSLAKSSRSETELGSEKHLESATEAEFRSLGVAAVVETELRIREAFSLGGRLGYLIHTAFIKPGDTNEVKLQRLGVAIHSLGDGASSLLPTLEPILAKANRYPNTAKYAAWLIAHAGRAGAHVLASALSNPSRNVRDAAEFGMRAYVDNLPRKVPVNWEHLLDDKIWISIGHCENEELRTWAFEAAWLFPDSHGSIEKLIFDQLARATNALPSQSLRAADYLLSSRINNMHTTQTNYLALAINWQENPLPAMRNEAVRVLGAFGPRGPRLVELLHRSSMDTNPDVRQAANDMLIQLKNENERANWP